MNPQVTLNKYLILPDSLFELKKLLGVALKCLYGPKLSPVAEAFMMTHCLQLFQIRCVISILRS